MKIVLIAPSGAIASPLGQLNVDPGRDEVVVISRTVPDTEVPSVLVSPSMRELTRRAESILGASVVGRNIQRVSPFDAGRRFAAAVRGSGQARAHVAAAELIVVLERDGILAGWQAARRWAPRTTPAVYGVPPGQAILAESR